MSFWMRGSQYRLAFIRNCYIWLQVFGVIIFHVLAGVQIIMIFSRSLSSKVLQNSFWQPWALLGLLGGSLCSLLFLVGLGSFFHRFGRCPNQDDFLEDFIFQSAPKLVLVTLASFGPPWGGLFRWSGTPDSRFHCGSIVNSAFWHSRFVFSFGSIVNSALWHPRFAFSLRIYSELCVPTPQIRVFTTEL